MLPAHPSRSRIAAALLALLVLFASQTPFLASAAPNAYDPRFGAVEAFRADAQADEAGVRWTRLVFWWSALQPDGPKSWNAFYFPDDLLQSELDRGRQVVGLLMNTPSWAGDGSTRRTIGRSSHARWPSATRVGSTTG
jgi:hypothetical protein